MLLVNFKTYKESSGENAVKLAKAMIGVSKERGIEIVACPQAVDLKKVTKVLPQRTWVQHVDPIQRGRATGWLPCEIAKECGATGTLLNHSEHKLAAGVLSETLSRCKEVGLKTLVFADSVKEAKLVAQLKPDWIGYEPPELVGSTETSVSRSKPDVIKKVVDAVSGIPILVGAGVKDAEDVRKSLELGAIGVAVASGVVKAEDVRKELLELMEGFK